MADEFANDRVRDVGQCRRSRPRGRKVGDELAEIVPVIDDRVRRRILDGSQILKIPIDSLFHSPERLPRESKCLAYGASLRVQQTRYRFPRDFSRNQGLAPTGVATSSGCGGIASGTTISQSHPSLRQLRTVPILVFFSTMKGAPHFGHGSATGPCGAV